MSSVFFVCCKLLVLKELVGANGFEPSTSWSRTRHLNPINALFGVAYGTRSVISPLSIVPKLYLDSWTLMFRRKNGPVGRTYKPDGPVFPAFVSAPPRKSGVLRLGSPSFSISGLTTNELEEYLRVARCTHICLRMYVVPRIFPLPN